MMMGDKEDEISRPSQDYFKTCEQNEDGSRDQEEWSKVCIIIRVKGSEFPILV